MSERTRGWYWVKDETSEDWELWGWEGSPSFLWHPCGSLARRADPEVIGSRIDPPGSDPSPAPCLDAKEMMRDVFTSWLKHHAAMSPAEPAARHTTDAMERARSCRAKLFHTLDRAMLEEDFSILDPIIAAAITSAVEQERQACAEIADEAARLADEVGGLKTMTHGAFAADLARDISNATRSRSAESPDTEGEE